MFISIRSGCFLFGHFGPLHCLGDRWIELVIDIYVYVGILVIYFKLNASFQVVLMNLFLIGQKVKYKNSAFKVS